MAFTKIAESCEDGTCPTFYRDDATGDVLVQGYRTAEVPDGLPSGEDVVRIGAADWAKLVSQLPR